MIPLEDSAYFRSLREQGVGGDHALVVGATGMLARATLTLAQLYSVVTVASRRAERFCQTHNRVPARLVAAKIDYRAPESVSLAVRTARLEYGNYDLALLWVHSDGSEAVSWILHDLSAQSGNCKVVHVRPSSAGVPDPSAATGQQIRGITYQRVVLGRIVNPQGWRWLSDDEICEGVLSALAAGTRHVFVGDRP